VHHLGQLRKSKTGEANIAMSRRQSEYTSAFVPPVKVLWVDVTRARENDSVSGHSSGTRASHIEEITDARCK
jgi:hypothetical protein